MLDIEDPRALLGYLRTTHRIASHEQPRIRTLAGGVSNRTVLVERPSGEAWVVKQALPKLRVADDWFSSPERIQREALGMRWLGRLLPSGSVPVLLWEDPEEKALAMSAVPQPHANLKELLLAGEALQHVEEFGRLLGALHRGGRERRDELAEVFGDVSFFESLRLEPYYRHAAARVEPAAAFLHALVDDTHLARLTLVHGDYSPKNVLVHAGRLVLLDHEVIHFGDPAFDLGFSLTHLLSKAHYHEKARAAFLEASRRYWRRYLEALGPAEWAPGLEPRAVRHALGCLLARVAGRSPLEYLDQEQRRRQRDAVIAMIGDPPASVPELIQEWGDSLGVAYADH